MNPELSKYLLLVFGENVWLFFQLAFFDSQTKICFEEIKKSSKSVEKIQASQIRKKHICETI